jgi:hypothetical protein
VATVSETGAVGGKKITIEQFFAIEKQLKEKFEKGEIDRDEFNDSYDRLKCLYEKSENSAGVGNPMGKLSGSVDGLTAAERTVINDLLSQGKNVEVIPKTTASKTPDFLVNGVKTELKTLENPNINTGITRIQKGFKQGAETVVIDGRQAGLTTEQANQIINRASGTYPNKSLPGKVEIWTNDGVIGR